MNTEQTQRFRYDISWLYLKIWQRPAVAR